MSLYKFLQEDLIFHHQIRLLVIFASHPIVDSVLNLLTERELPCKVLLVLDFISQRELHSGVIRIKVENDKEAVANFTVTRYQSKDDRRESRRFQVLGKRSVKQEKAG